jgi:hypothetical protein
MAIKMQIEDLKKTIQKAEDKNSNIKNVVKNKFLLTLKNIFRNKNILQISWSQYTPYFNDGEECVFSVSDVTTKVNKEFKDYVETLLNNHLIKLKTEKEKKYSYMWFSELENNSFSMDTCSIQYFKQIKNYSQLLKDENFQIVYDLMEINELVRTDFIKDVLKSTLGDHSSIVINKKGEDEIEVSVDFCEHD